MPSEHQQAGESREYRHEAHRHVCEWPERKLKQVVPMKEDTAREYLGAANEEECSQELIEHFAACVADASY